jgi:hypothetical protein
MHKERGAACRDKVSASVSTGGHNAQSAHSQLPSAADAAAVWVLSMVDLSLTSGLAVGSYIQLDT